MIILGIDADGVHHTFKGAPDGTRYVFSWEEITQISAVRYWSAPGMTRYQGVTLEFDLASGEYFAIHEADLMWGVVLRFLEEHVPLVSMTCVGCSRH